MTAKGLLQNWYERPSLVLFYNAANVKTFGSAPFVHEKHFPLFSVLEDDIRDLGATPRDYAYTVVGMLKGWVRDKGFKNVPIRVFCGDWAFHKFCKVWRSETVEIIDDDSDNVLYSELIVARAFIQEHRNGNLVKMSDVVSDLRPFLYPRWVCLYDTGGQRPTRSALEILRREYRAPGAKSYSEIVRMLDGR